MADISDADTSEGELIDLQVSPVVRQIPYITLSGFWCDQLLAYPGRQGQRGDDHSISNFGNSYLFIKAFHSPPCSRSNNCRPVTAFKVAAPRHDGALTNFEASIFRTSRKKYATTKSETIDECLALGGTPCGRKLHPEPKAEDLSPIREWSAALAVQVRYQLITPDDKTMVMTELSDNPGSTCRIKSFLSGCQHHLCLP
ncbi:hypothetical protein GWK47_047039 [Chionoecetes opilio]|uniref:Uncharacterized protein n=1 Tax=Chionoecetes opilio TaxID=41210 RepID=A0A8J4YDB8_CHIOP|nr:hypothetical protein GWK47_047039 [Chionoecetes opilio]